VDKILVTGCWMLDKIRIIIVKNPVTRNEYPASSAIEHNNSLPMLNVTKFYKISIK
jgi:hypothetical protein